MSRKDKLEDLALDIEFGIAAVLVDGSFVAGLISSVRYLIGELLDSIQQAWQFCCGGTSMRRWAILFSVIAAWLPTHVVGHPGGLAADGCHNDRKNGGRHCHRSSGGSAPAASRPQRLISGDTYYPNCAAARAAGAAPVRRGAPGYGEHLDRDGDGVGCE